MKKEFIGKGASPGVLSGFAFVVDNPLEICPDDMQNGDVLIVRFATPLYFELFIKAGAIITEVGGITCHAASIAREMGIPCVVSVENIVSLVKTGEQIFVDGSKGLVYVKSS